ncbi:MAG: prepilin peptidase [Candidatus Saccharibacteria bacterium]|nr:prepilin peptidase [Candidatus Saccharibacteria bacterium]
MVITIIFLLGLGFGSFVNAAVWRMRQQQVKSKKLKAESKNFSVLKGRSICTNCGHRLAWYDLFPVLSWLSLKGKCRYCQKPINPQYPLVELLTAALFVVSYAFWPLTFSFQLTALSVFVTWLLLLTLLVALAVYDLKWMELPDKVVGWVSGLTALFILLQLAGGEVSGGDVAQILSGGALLSVLFYILFQLSGGKWIGGGDVKLAPALGVLAGSPLAAVLLLFVASLLGTLIGLPLMIARKNKRNIKLPFGPLLIFGLLVVFFFGQGMIDWYLNDILYL